MANNFDGNVQAQAVAPATDVLYGVGTDTTPAAATGGLLCGTFANLAALNTVITAAQGTIAPCQDGTVCINTDGATAWALV
jgi:hypothetical protein